ncbi:MAG: hypothetical protein HZA21_04635 [Nitrospirae bacterium]|nr:hypothetical protein [Nitrospirota bacterium]
MPLDQTTESLHYRVCGLILASDSPLQDLAPLALADSSTIADLRLRMAVSRREFPAPSNWIMSWKLPTGELWLSCSKEEQGYLLRFHDTADFFVDKQGRELLCRAEPGTPPHTLHHLILNQALPLVINLRGQEALHATAVLTPWGVCAFTGPTGTGKSTLAAGFLSAGYPVLSDDCLVLQERDGRILAVPAYPELRLWEDSFDALYHGRRNSLPVAHYSSKRRVTFEEHPADFPTAPQPLTRIYILPERSVAGNPEGGAMPALERIAGRESFMALLTSLFRLDVTDGAMLTRQFHFLDRLLSLVPVRRLRIPSAFSALSATRETILTDLQSSG